MNKLSEQIERTIPQHALEGQFVNVTAGCLRQWSDEARKLEPEYVVCKPQGHLDSDEAREAIAGLAAQHLGLVYKDPELQHGLENS